MKFSHFIFLVFFSSLISLFDFVICGSIQSWDIETLENKDGIPNGFKLHFNLETGLTDSDYIQISFPDNVVINKSDLYLFENTLIIVQDIVCINNPTFVNKQYFCKYGVTLQKDTWYTLHLKINPSSINWVNAVTEPVEMQTISDTCISIANCSPIIYDINNYFGYLLRAQNTPALSTALIRISYSPSILSQIPGQIYYAYLDITPQTNYIKGATYIITIEPASPLLDPDFNFKFSELCYSYALNCPSTTSSSCISIPEIQKSKCEIAKNQSYMIFQVNQSLNINQTFRIKVQVQNPLTIMSANIILQGISSDTSRTEENGLFVNAFQTNIIKILKGRFNFMWGISQNELALQNDMPYTLFKSDVIPTVNSVYISFKVDQSLPLGQEYYVEICLGLASGIIENSIVTNLPNLDLGKQPRCYQRIDASTKLCYVACEQVGALIYANYEYFISVKVQYTFASLNFGISSQTQVYSYGQVNIKIKNKPLLPLYLSFLGESIPILQNTEYLDSNGATGFNDVYGLGSSQIISYADSKQISGVPNGVENFLSSVWKNTVGITPVEGSDQQLLFFLKVTKAQFDQGNQMPTVAGSGNIYISRMSIMYNPKNILYEQGYDNMGIDMAAFRKQVLPEPDKWIIDELPCYKADKCSWYNQTSISGARNYLQKSPFSASINYNIHRFECISDYVNDCDNWQGLQYADGASGVFSMRRIKFTSGFQSQIQADDDLIDFVVAFHLSKYQAGVDPVYTLQTAQLINAYTIQINPLLTSKISFINFSEKALNPGHLFPTFLRIGGSISRQEHLGANAIAVFFDDSLELKAFYDEYNASNQGKKDIGCSFNNCYLHSSNGIFGQETWMTSNMVLATGFSDIENEFNLLIPIQNKLDGGGNILFPKRLVIAFCDFSKTSQGVQNQLKILSVYRIYGAPVRSDIKNKILPIYTLSALAALDLTVSQWASNLANQSAYDVDINDIQPSSTKDTQFKAQASVKTNHNANYAFGNCGAGFTFSSLNYNVFAPSTLSMINPSFGVAQTCTKFSYTFNDLQGLYPDYNKFKVYNVFCPVDGFLTDIGSIKWINPQLDYAMSSSLKLSSILKYSFSSGIGMIYSFYSETQSVNALYFNQCFINSIMKDLHPNSQGKQAIDLSFQMKATVPFDISGQTGFGFMRVKVGFNVPFVGLTQYTPNCFINNYLTDQFTCTIYQFLTDQWHILFTPKTKYFLDLLENINFTVYVDATLMSAMTNVKYMISVYLPTEKSAGVSRIFGKYQSTPFPTNFILLSECGQVGFKISSSPYLQIMKLDSIQFDVKNSLAKSPFQFTFSMVSPRERFYSSSYIRFDLGFLIAPYAIATSNRAQNIRCSVLETLVTSSPISNYIYVQSWKWKYISYSSDLRDVRLYPKQEFKDPNQYIFALRCQGTYTPDNTQMSLNIQSKWIDGSSATMIQQTTSLESIPFPTSSDILDLTNISTTSYSLYSKLFNQQGFESSYTFRIQSNLVLNYYTRIYITFPQYVGVGVNREQHPECYTKVNNLSSNIITPADIKLAYCEIIDDNRISLYLNLILSPNTPFHIIIHGIAQPYLGNKSNLNNEIWIGIDEEGIISNGIKQQQIINDIPPTTLNTLPTFEISSVSISNNYVRSKYDVNIKFDAKTLQIGQTLYVLFPYNFAEIAIGDSITCTLTQFQIGTTQVIIPSTCQFITQRIIRITLTVIPTTYFKYSLTFNNIQTPFYVPEYVKNQIRVYLFETLDSIGPPITSKITRIGLDYFSNYYSFTRDLKKIDLLWSIYSQNKIPDSNNINNIIQSENFEMQRTVFVNIGYFKRIVRLKPENNDNYQISLSIILSGQISFFKFIPSIFSVIRGEDNIEMRIGALQTTPTGIYQIKASKIGDDNKIYDNIANLQVIVSGEACKIQARQYYYEIPIGGISLPIELDFSNCMPLDDIIFTPLLTNTNSNQLDFDSNYLVNKISGSDQKNRMYFVIIEKTNDNSRINQSVLLTFQISGTNQYSFLPPDKINLKLVSSPTTIFPTPSPITNIIVDQNSAQFEIQCDQSGIAFWVIGIDPSITPILFNDIFNIVTGPNGLQPTAVQSLTDKQQKIYGFDVSYINKPIKKLFDQLNSNTYYSFKYFCYNQMKTKSTSETISWKTPDNGAYLLKIIIYFDYFISYKQQQQLSCSIKNFFSLPQLRVVSDINTKCGEYPNYINLKIDNLNVKNKINSYYPYMFYIQPDYKAKRDQTNIEIKELIRQNSFITNFKASIPSSSTYPTIQKIETQDIFTSLSPEIAVLTSIQAQQTTALIYLKIRNINGYIIVGLEEGKSNTSPSPDQIKMGLNYLNKNLVTFEMRYSEREIKQEFKFIQLKTGTQYTAYFIGSTDDPSSNSEITQPIIINFQTIGDSYVVEIVSSSIIRYLFLVSLIFIILF